MFAPLTVNTPAVRPEGGHRGSEKKKKTERFGLSNTPFQAMYIESPYVP